MLFVLTGHIQIGKTRWLERLVDDLERTGATAYGVIAPGVWADRRDDPASYPHADANGFEKLGIDNVLLPNREKVAFARRVDLAAQEGTFDPSSQSARAKLAWHISDEAIERVNGYFATLCDPYEQETETAGLLIVDELGRLELELGQGLTQAVRALENGPSPRFQHALIVVRDALLPRLEGRFGAWGERVEIGPDEQSRELVLKSALWRPPTIPTSS